MATTTVTWFEAPITVDEFERTVCKAHKPSSGGFDVVEGRPVFWSVWRSTKDERIDLLVPRGLNGRPLVGMVAGFRKRAQ